MLKVKKIFEFIETRTDMPDYRLYGAHLESPENGIINAGYDNGRIREIYIFTPGGEYDFFSFRADDFNNVSHYKVVEGGGIRYRDGAIDRRYHRPDHRTITSEGRIYHQGLLEDDALFPGLAHIEKDINEKIREFIKARPDIVLPSELVRNMHVSEL